MKIARIEVSPNDITGEWGIDIYVCGCKRKCPECQNKELWDFNSYLGTEMTIEELYKRIEKKFFMGSSVNYYGGDFYYFLDEYCRISEIVSHNGLKNILYTGANEGDICKKYLKYTDFVLYGEYNPKDPNKIEQFKEKYKW